MYEELGTLSIDSHYVYSESVAHSDYCDVYIGPYTGLPSVSPSLWLYQSMVFGIRMTDP